MEIKVSGPGCANCHTREKLAQTAVRELCIDATIKKLSDVQEIMDVYSGPVLNGKLKHSRKSLTSLEKVKELIKAEA